MLAACIPWTGGDRWRRLSMRRVVAHLQEHSIAVYTGDGRSRSHARNQAAAAARLAGADVLLFVDADTELPIHHIRAAVEHVVEHGQPAFPFDVFLKARYDSTRELIAGHSTPPNAFRRAATNAKVLPYPAGGALVVTSAMLDVVGGYDERFKLWGLEDRAFLNAVETLVEPAVRLPGVALHWWHPAADKAAMHGPRYAEVRALASRYREAAGYVDVGYPDVGWPRQGPKSKPIRQPDRAAMLAVLAEPGGPLAPSHVRHR